MPLVLAIEPDPRQATTLKRVVRAGVRTKLVVVDSKDAALAAIAADVPDLILVTALLPPRDEDELTRHLKTLEHAGHLQTLTIPMFASARSEERLGGRLFGGLRRKKRAPAIDGCDPKVFGEQIEAYLQRATELRDEQRALDAVIAEASAAAPQPVVEQSCNPSLAPQAPAEQEPPRVEQDFGPALVTPERPSILIREPSVVEQGSSPAFAGQPAPVEDVSPALAASPPPEAATDEVDDDDAEWQVIPLEDQASDVAPGAEMAVADPIPEQREETIEQAAEAHSLNTGEDVDAFVLTAPVETVIADESSEEAPATIALPAEARDGHEQLALESIEDDARASQAPAQDGADYAEIAAAAATAARNEPEGDQPPSLMREASDVVHTAFAHALGNLHAFATRVGSGLKSRGPAPTLDIEGMSAGGDETERNAARRETAATSDENEPRHGAPLATAAGPDARDMAIADRFPSSEQAAQASRVEERDGSARLQEAASPSAAANDERQPAQAIEERTDGGNDGGAAAGDDSTRVGQIDTGGKANTGKNKKRRRRRGHATRPAADLEMALAGVESRWLASAIAALRVDIQQLREETRTVAGVTTAFSPPPDAAHGTGLEPSATCAGDEPGGHNRSGNGDGKNGNGNGKTNGNDNGDGQAQAAKKDPEPIEDEWGFYNPERCGMQALMAKLEESGAATAAVNQAAGAANQPAGAAHEAAGEPNWQEFAAGDGGPETAERSSGAQARSQTSDLKRLAPLAMWARADEQMEHRVEDILPGAPSTHASNPTARLRFPDEVAAVRYASGCRIRRVRVAPRPKQLARDKRQVVIVSKKVLDNLR